VNGENGVAAKSAGAYFAAAKIQSNSNFFCRTEDLDNKKKMTERYSAFLQKLSKQIDHDSKN
jgi:hypothetical protein